jgi:hypothetical protein
VLRSALTERCCLHRLSRDGLVSIEPPRQADPASLEAVHAHRVRVMLAGSLVTRGARARAPIWVGASVGGSEAAEASPAALTRWDAIYIIEDNSRRATRRRAEGLPRTRGTADVVLRVHVVTEAGVSTLAETRYVPGAAGRCQTSTERRRLHSRCWTSSDSVIGPSSSQDPPMARPSGSVTGLLRDSSSPSSKSSRGWRSRSTG